MRSMEELLDELAERCRVDLTDPRRLRAEFDRIVARLAREGVALPPQDDATRPPQTPTRKEGESRPPNHPGRDL